MQSIKKSLVYKNLLRGLHAIKAERAFKFFRRRRPLVLMYHRVCGDNGISGISPAYFSNQLDYLQENFNLISLKDLVSKDTGEEVDHAVAITFDDGYRDFYYEAWPLLKQRGIPATLFVTSGFIDGDNWLWPDILKYCSHAEKRKFISFVERVLPLNARKAGHCTWQCLADYCLNISDEKRLELIKQLFIYCGMNLPDSPPHQYRPLTWDMLRKMRQDGLEIGSHTVTHGVLSKMTLSKVEWELSESFKRIESEIGVPPSGICYPNGRDVDISKDVIDIASRNYNYGVVAVPSSKLNYGKMTIGRRSSVEDPLRFKRIVNGMTFDWI